MRIVFLPILITFVLGCSEKSIDPNQLINEAIAAHGELKGKTISFTFREREYSVTRDEAGYTYTRSWNDDSLGIVMDILVNSKLFTRRINGDKVPVDSVWQSKYGNSVNSVLYFFQLSYPLNDKGAIKKYVGKFQIKGHEYFGVQVTFTENGGGKDFEDVFLYWIHAKNKTVDYFAYSYLTDEGGVRFREAINRREIKGLLIQDYVNHKANKDVDLQKLPQFFEEGKLENLSMIINENVRVTELK